MEFRFRGHGFWSANRWAYGVRYDLKIIRRDEDDFEVELWGNGVEMDCEHFDSYSDAVAGAERIFTDFLSDEEE